jgi:hypothetical protein
MQTGQNVHDPLTQLNSHMGYGLMAGLNPFADMGVNPNDPNMVNFISSVAVSRGFDKYIASVNDEFSRVPTTDVFFNVESGYS